MVAPRTRKKKGTEQAELSLPVAYGNVNVGDKTARLGISVHRGNLTVTQADKHLCGKRLTGKIVARAGDAQAEQESLPDMEADTELAGVFDVKGFGVTGKHITFGLTFAIESIDIATLAHFARREGKLVVESISDIPEEEAVDGGGDDPE